MWKEAKPTCKRHTERPWLKNKNKIKPRYYRVTVLTTAPHCCPLHGGSSGQILWKFHAGYQWSWYNLHPFICSFSLVSAGLEKKGEKAQSNPSFWTLTNPLPLQILQFIITAFNWKMRGKIFFVLRIRALSRSLPLTSNCQIMMFSCNLNLWLVIRE